MKALFLAIGSVLIFLLMQAAVGALHWYEEGVAWVYGSDLALIAGAVVLLAKTRLSKAMIWLATVLVWCVMVYEWVRAVGLETMSQEPLLYDALFLGKHLYFLMSDLLGDGASKIVWSLLGALVGSFVVFHGVGLF